MSGPPPDFVRVEALWTGDHFTGPTRLSLVGECLHPTTSSPERPNTHDGSAPSNVLLLGGTVVPSLTDHHTHLGLSDPGALFQGGITHAVDLGWIPSVAAAWLDDSPHRPAIAIAGALLTAPGGYPVNAGWAPPGAAKEVGGPREAREAVRQQVMAGASRIKIALNSDAGETVDNASLSAIVEESHAAGLPVVAHAQGAGQTARALRGGVDQLAHTPFTERLDDDVVAEAVDAGMIWISTLDIHGWGTPTTGYRIAVDNLRRFIARGGHVLYGTDLGNGDLPVGVNARELAAIQEAGLQGVDLIRTIAGTGTGAGPCTGSSTDATAPAPLGPRIAWIPSPPPADPAHLPGWLATARGLHISDLASTDLRQEHP
ncbi:hypothetical protein ACPPVW_05805 [Leifsonia sp. McL0607]|uniref:hypothetical protein n=1 Tax=Leifsonia sp. McL0607 TaxID=3415672 RepID=UPI003CEFE615